MLGVKPFTAEWAALGKGQRKEKYRSFTITEQWVPTLFFWLLAAILVFLIVNDWQFLASWLTSLASSSSGG